MMTVEEVMTTSVESCALDEPLLTVARRMALGRFACLPVLEDDVLAGVITSSDLQRALRHDEAALTRLSVNEVMTADLSFVVRTDPLDSAMHLIRKTGHRELPVADADGHLVGMLTVSDLVDAAPVVPSLFSELQRTLEQLEAREGSHP